MRLTVGWLKQNLFEILQQTKIKQKHFFLNFVCNLSNRLKKGVVMLITRRMEGHGFESNFLQCPKMFGKKKAQYLLLYVLWNVISGQSCKFSYDSSTVKIEVIACL